MTDRTTRQLKAREAELLAELRARRSNSEKQAALITGDDLDLDEVNVSEAHDGPESASERQAAMATARTPDYSGTTSERQARAARGVDPGVEDEHDRKRRLIREAFNRSTD